MAEKDSKEMKKLDKRIKKETKLSSLSDEQKEIIRFAIIIGVIVIFVGVVYGISRIFIKEEEEKLTEDVTPGVISYDVVTVGTMFNRPLDEYYVISYDTTINEAVYYSALVNKYKLKDKALKVYILDLNNKLNQDYYQGNEKSNKKAKTLNELALGDFTLMKIQNGKIVKYIESVDDVKEEWDL